MQSRLALASAVISLWTGASVVAENHDYLQPGATKGTAEYQIKHDRAVRHVFGRGWHSDVVVRMVDIPPFQAESVSGVAHTASGYQVFNITASEHISSERRFGSDDQKHKKDDHCGINPILHERAIPEALAGRILAVWRRVLTDSRNYGKDSS